MDKLKILLTTVCKINYESNCHNCPLRIEGRCSAATEQNTYNADIEPIAEEFLKDKSIYLYQSKEDEKAIYLTNGKVNSKGNYLLVKLGHKESILIDELTLINDYTEITNLVKRD